MFNFTTVYLPSTKTYIKARQLYLQNTTQLNICSLLLDFIFNGNKNSMWAARLVIDIKQLCVCVCVCVSNRLDIPTMSVFLNLCETAAR